MVDTAQSHSSTSAAVLTIDLSAVVANWRYISDLVGPAEAAAVVKADAYGLGAKKVTAALGAVGCKTFFVAHPNEAFELLPSLSQTRLFVLHGTPEGSGPALANAGTIPVLNHWGQVDDYSALANKLGRKLPAALHIDTGMTRLGFSAHDLATLINAPEHLQALDIVLIMSHLACADEPEHEMNRAQRESFQQLLKFFPTTHASLVNSAGCFLGPEYSFDLTRPGIALYGGNPVAPLANPMREVVQITAKILQTQLIDRPQTVGYGATRRLPKGACIATVAVGYADGYLRSLGNTGFAVIGGVRVPLVGRVSMDLITLDVSTLPANAVKVGTTVHLLGGGVPVDDLAERAGTIDYELLTSLGNRYQREYIG